MEVFGKDLSVIIDGNKIVENIDFASKSNEFIGIIGPNGSGKSTLLKTVYRVLKPTSGAVYLDEKNLNKHSLKESAKKISVVAQHNYYSFDFTVEEVVLMGRAPHKKSMQRYDKKDYELVRRALKAVGLSDFADRNYTTLSGGEAQRVVLARALAQNTPCLILDEPTNHLDIKHQLDIMRIVKGLDKTVISAIHDLNIAAMYCDRIYALKDGRVMFSGTPDEVLNVKTIKNVFDVEAEIIYNECGDMRIYYKL